MSEEHIDYTKFVARLKKSGEAIIADLTPTSADALHMAVGVSGEAGELLDAVKKYAIYAKALDRTNVIEELGDLEFFMEGLRQILGITREQTLDANKQKLGKRYAEKCYSNTAANLRADKQT